MTYNNQSPNMANLLRYQLQPIQNKRNPVRQEPQPIFPKQRARQQIPYEEVFTPPQDFQRRSIKRRTPMSSGNGGGQGPLRTSNRTEDGQIDGLRVRLQQIVKFYDQRHKNLETNLSQRLNGLQNLVMREMPKVDNASMMKADIIGFKDAVKDLRKQTQYQAQQIASLGARFQQRNNQMTLAANDPRQKQKMTVLFMEVVRLSDAVEKMDSGVGAAGRNYQSRIQQLEHKLANSEKNLSILAQRNANGNDVLSELGDKVMDRLQTAQNNLLILGKQRLKDKETINQLISQNDRTSEDMQHLLRNMQSDFQNKLQNRISDTVNRLIAEHEERVNAQDQIRRNLDIRQRMNQQKQNNDKQQFRTRYQNMDALVRIQFQKKDESIKLLQNLLQNQVKNMQKMIYDEGSHRKEQQGVLKSQIKRVQQSFRKQYDIYKSHQSDVLQRISELVKQQVQVRVSSEINLKKLTSDIANELVNDLNGVKQAISASNKKLNTSIREVANDSSERSGQLSHYIDQQIKKVVEVVTDKYSKMKSVFTKLAQQFKQHLTNTEANRQNVEKRLTRLEDDFEKLKNQVDHQIEQFYGDLDARLKQQKQYVQTFIFKKNNDLTIRVNKLEQYTNQYFELLKGNIQENKQLLSNKLQNGNESKSPQSQQEIKELRTIVFNVKNLLEETKNQNKQELEDFKRELKQKEGKNKVARAEKQTEWEEKITKNSQGIKELQGKHDELSVKVNSLRADGGSEATISNDKMKKLSDEVDELNVKMKNMEKQAADSAQATDQQFIRVRKDITVLKGEVGALDADLKRLSSS